MEVPEGKNFFSRAVFAGGASKVQGRKLPRGVTQKKTVGHTQVYTKHTSDEPAVDKIYEQFKWSSGTAKPSGEENKTGAKSSRGSLVPLPSKDSAKSNARARPQIISNEPALIM